MRTVGKAMRLNFHVLHGNKIFGWIKDYGKFVLMHFIFSDF